MLPNSRLLKATLTGALGGLLFGLPSSDKQLRATWPHGLSRSWRTIVGKPPYSPAPDSDHVLIEPRPPELAGVPGLSLSQRATVGKYLPVYPVATIVILPPPNVSLS
jgi:hypothetical protein